MKRQLAESDAASRRAKQRGGGAKRQRTREKVLAPEEADALRLELERTQNRLAQDARRAKREQIKSAVRQEEVAAVKQGKKPFFPKRSALRERELKAQFEQITIAQASDDKDTRVENSTQSSKAALLLVVCRCQQLLRRALKAEDKLQARRR